MNLASQMCPPGRRLDTWTISGGKVDPPSPTSRQGGVVVKPLGTVESAPLLDRSEDQLLQRMKRMLPRRRPHCHPRSLILSRPRASSARRLNYHMVVLSTCMGESTCRAGAYRIQPSLCTVEAGDGAPARLVPLVEDPNAEATGRAEAQNRTGSGSSSGHQDLIQSLSPGKLFRRRGHFHGYNRSQHRVSVPLAS